MNDSPNWSRQSGIDAGRDESADGRTLTAISYEPKRVPGVMGASMGVRPDHSPRPLQPGLMITASGGLRRSGRTAPP